MTAVRPPILAGSWYPAQPDVLRERVATCLAGAEPHRLPAGTPVIALAPHAGYQYSGPTAGKIYGLLAGRRYDAVFILAPSHRARLQRPALSSVDAFATPLGEVPVAVAIVRDLADTGAYEVNDRAHAFEHAVEIQLPLLQCALPAGTPIVPILFPHLDLPRRRDAARALDRWRDGRHLFLVSSDLTHYGADYGYVPFTEDIPNRLAQLDTGALQKFLAGDAAGLVAYAEATGITMCGLEAAAVAIAAPLPAGAQSVLLDYTRSGDPAGDYDLSVSYAAAVICRPNEAIAGDRLSPAERAYLVRLARAAVEAAVRGEPPPDPAAVARAAGCELSPRLRAERGAFVTLTLDGRLRGCIGYIEGIKPLVEAVIDNAASAAVNDPRFTPVRPADLAPLHVEVSVLSPLRAVPGPEAIEVGRHGILLSKGRRQAVFLPQVATEQGWDLTTTLDHLAVKAGLPANAWRQDCAFQVFTAEICEA
ncbi:MAG: AmmeMemoRadiSam system protein B [Candidatus Krumholzibacteria bacterium]|jgi:AmmeMemoRadiSam system protein B/AmmeMemoRadiSam system protein A|nr:AmmeMemoRadiSam system protein B [Candidatus Krumholzibacteria bacterium]